MGNARLFFFFFFLSVAVHIPFCMPAFFRFSRYQYHYFTVFLRTLFITVLQIRIILSLFQKYTHPRPSHHQHYVISNTQYSQESRYNTSYPSPPLLPPSPSKIPPSNFVSHTPVRQPLLPPLNIRQLPTHKPQKMSKARDEFKEVSFNNQEEPYLPTLLLSNRTRRHDWI